MVIPTSHDDPIAMLDKSVQRTLLHQLLLAQRNKIEDLMRGVIEDQPNLSNLAETFNSLRNDLLALKELATDILTH